MEITDNNGVWLVIICLVIGSIIAYLMDKQNAASLLGSFAFLLGAIKFGS